MPSPPVIQPATTSTAAFIGTASRGPVHKPARIRSIADFTRRFGKPRDDLELGNAVAQFFNNRGTDAWVVRIQGPVTTAKIKRALADLDVANPINLLALPGLTRPEWIRPVLAYAKKRRAFVICDPARNATPSLLLKQMERSPFSDGANGAIFYPWVQVSGADPRKAPRLSPPSGAIAGLFARNDREGGIWKASAGINAVVRGVVGLAHDVSQSVSEQLAAQGVNILRKLPTDQFVVWSARTLPGDGTAPGEWKYIPVRRLALFIEESIERGTRWAVFEPNGEPLWAQIRSSIEIFLHDLWRNGALLGDKPEKAYFVKCDRTTMTQDDIDNGQLNITIGIAPLRPAEFVILRIGQWVKRDD